MRFDLYLSPLAYNLQIVGNGIRGLMISLAYVGLSTQLDS